MSLPSGAPGSFSLEALNPPGLKQDLVKFFVDHVMPAGMGLMRRIAPVLHIPFTKTWFVTGFDAAQEVFSRQEDFVSPIQPKCDVLDWQHFVLALPDDDLYWHIHEQMRLLWRDDDLERVAAIARRESAAAIAEAIDGRLDFIQDFVVRVGLAVLRDYYGVRLPDNPQPFFDGVLYGNGFVFAPPKIKPKIRDLARQAMAEVWPVLDAALAAQRANPDPDTVIGRYYSDADISSKFAEADFRSSLMAMIGGFLPANTNSNGRTLTIFLDDTDVLNDARRAALDGDDGALLRMLHEAMRLDYIIPMLWRRPVDNTWLGIGAPKQVPIPKDAVIALSNKVAMRDPARVPDPMRFDADRSEHQYLVYGHDFHYCIGAALNDTLLEAQFGVLLQHRVERAGRTQWAGLYPWRFPIRVEQEA